MKRGIFRSNLSAVPQTPLFFFSLASKLLWVFQLVSLKHCYCLALICLFLSCGVFSPLITIKSHNNYYSSLSPFLVSVNLISFWACIFESYIPSSILHPCFWLFFFGFILHSCGWDARTNLFSDVPFFSFKKISLVAGNMNSKTEQRSHFLYFIHPQKAEQQSQSESVRHKSDLAYRIQLIWLPQQRY